MHIEITNLSFRHKTPGARPEPVLQDIKLDIRAGELLALVGLSGSGKTTLMQHLTGLLRPDSGRVCIDGVALHSKSADLTAIRRKLSLVFQFPESQLFADTVFEDIAFGPRNLALPASEVAERVRLSCRQVGLDFERYRLRAPFQLSEGEKRRVALAGVLAMQPEGLALDEPTAGLDWLGVRAVTEVVQELHEAGKTVLLISHNLDWVVSLVSRVVVLHRGRIHFDGSKQELVRQPELLHRAGLTLPRIFKLAGYLEQRGLASVLDEIYPGAVCNQMGNKDAGDRTRQGSPRGSVTKLHSNSPVSK